jgi:hypothetical protein
MAEARTSSLSSPDIARAALSKSALGLELLAMLDDHPAVESPAPPEKYASQEYLCAATRASYALADFPSTEPECLTSLLRDSLALATTVDREPRHVLSDAARRETFHAWSGRPELESALAESAASEDPETSWLARLLGPARAESAAQLRASLVSLNLQEMTVAADALAKALPIEPKLETLARDVRRRLDREEVLAALRILIRTKSPVGEGGGDDEFVGRELELEQLYAHVGVRPPLTLLNRLSRIGRGISETFSRSNGALVIHAIGGMGKSSLIAKFVMEHARSDDAGGIFFAYLDFDRKTLADANAAGLLAEIARQVGLQSPAGRGGEELEGALHTLRTDLREIQGRSSEPYIGEHAKRFMKTVDMMTVSNKPFLLVLDTLERMQSQGAAAMRRIVALLAELGTYDGRWPRLRVVACGRADEVELRDQGKPAPIQLGPFDLQGAERLAARLLEARLGRTEPDWAVEIGKASNGYPLAVRVMTERLAEAQPEDRSAVVEDIRAARGDASKIATIFYKRFAERISFGQQSNAAGAFAPLKAVVCLRTVTVPMLAAALEAVTAAARQVPESAAIAPQPPTAATMFEALRRDPTLWAEIGADYLRWSPHLRRLLLQSVREENPTLLKSIAARVFEAAQNAPPGDGRNADLIYYGLLAGRGVQDADGTPRGPKTLALLDGVDEDFPADSPEQVFLRLLARGESPSRAEVASLPPSTALRLILAAESRFSEFGGRSFDQRIPALRDSALPGGDPVAAERNVRLLVNMGDPVVTAQAFRLSVKTGAWPEAMAFPLGPWIKEAAAREALFFLGARTRLPEEMKAVFLRALDDTQTQPARPELVHRLVAARVREREIFERLDSDDEFRRAKEVREFGDEGYMLLAGTFGEAAAVDWASEAYQRYASGGTNYGGGVSSRQFRLIMSAAGRNPESEEVASEEFGDGISSLKVWPFGFSHSFRLLAAVGDAFRKLGTQSPAAARAATRAFCALRDPYWAEPLGYSLSRLYDAGAVTGNDAVKIVNRLAGEGVLGKQLAARCASPSVSRDPIIFLQTLDDASALPVFIDAMRAHALDVKSGWISRLSKTVLGGNEEQRAYEAFIAVAEDYRRWGETKSRVASGPSQAFSIS